MSSPSATTRDQIKVPFLDLGAQYKTIKDEIATAIQDVLDHTAFAGGPAVERFEKAFAAYCGTRHAIGVGNGTDAIWAALLGMGIGQGDEVITVTNTFIATAEAISYTGATPVFVDVLEDTCNMDPAKLEAAITPRTKAIIPVHLYGQMADMDAVMEIAQKHKLMVIEDASQAHGAEWRGRRAGQWGVAGCFSFYPGKNLGAYGEAGAVVTDDDALAAKIRRFRDHGQAQKYYHDEVGWNARMDGIQGAVLGVKLPYLEGWTERRRAHARRYNELLAGIPGIVTPVEAAGARHVYHLYVIRTPRRDELMNFLRERDVFCAIHYPVPLHLQKAYAGLGLARGAFPVAERVADEIVSLPMFAELSDAQIERVAEGIREFAQLNVSR